MTQSAEVFTKKSLPIVDDALADVDAELRRFEVEQRQERGIETEKRWLEDMANLYFTKQEKDKVTLLIGGLTMAHDYLVEGAFKSLGYNVVALDCPDYDALRVGKEFGNRAQCNPTYFTVGNLVKYLIHLRDEKGIPAKEIIDRFVFLTAGACGPCRFGMYVTEYRKALRDAGFDGFRVMLFQQQGGLDQATGDESGLELKPPFFIALIKALLAGDVINGIGYRLRPYEKVAGSTDTAIAEAKRICYDTLERGGSILWALRKSKKIFEAVEVDRTQVKPRVAIIGEFWAMTTEGDGNYQLQRFLEKEGGECDIQFITAWLLYNIWEVRNDTKNRALLRHKDGGRSGLAGTSDYDVFVKKIGLWAAELALRGGFQTFAHAGGFYGYHLPDMDEVADVAAPYYDNDLRGGEGHMEVGKLILNVVKQKANMTLSVKPFGCMPSSSVSDGVQSLITEKFPGSIFCAVETSGDGAVNFQSRVQMYMFKARQAAHAELDTALEKTGLTLQQVQGYLAKSRLGGALHHPQHSVGSTASDLVYEVGERYGKSRWQLALGSARRSVTAVRSGVARAIETGPERARKTAELSARVAIELGEIARDSAPGVAHSARHKLGQVLKFPRKKNTAVTAAAS